MFRYWWIRERPTAHPRAAADDLPPEYSFRMLGIADRSALLAFPALGAPMTTAVIEEALARGDHCVGVVRDGRIVGFGWWSVGRTATRVHPVQLTSNEAYLHNMYVLPEHRGAGLAPLIRRHTYEVLAREGVDTCYSITALDNLPSWRFKEKLGAEKLLLGWYLGIRDRWHFRITLWRYAAPPARSDPGNRADDHRTTTTE